MKIFNKALLAIMQNRTDEADELFAQFVSEQLNEDDAEVDDDQLSGDLEAEDSDEPGLTEDDIMASDEADTQK